MNKQIVTFPENDKFPGCWKGKKNDRTILQLIITLCYHCNHCSTYIWSMYPIKQKKDKLPDFYLRRI